MAMQCFTDLIAPTAVTHSVSLPFLSSAANNLVVAKSSLLQIFSFKSVIANAKDGTGNLGSAPSHHLIHTQTGDLDSPLRTTGRRNQRSERTHTTKFVLVAQYELSGTVIGLVRVKTMQSKSGGEALLVALRNAKLSLLEWDPERYCISTISIHYYEREDLQGSPWSPELSRCVNYLAVDPGSRCAALKFGARSIAILPFHQAGDDLVMDDYDPEFDSDPPKPDQSPNKVTNGETTSTHTPYGASFVLSLLMLDPNLTHPIHLAFLHEYREPTFGVLSSRLATSSALLHERQETVLYTVYTLDLEQRASTTLLSVSGLPYDLHTVLPLPLPIGGALLIGFNELIHVDQAGKTNGIAVNEFAKQYSSFPLAQQSGLDLKLEGCVIEQLGTPNGEMLLLLQTGDLAVLEFKRDGRSISGLLLRALSSTGDGFRLKTATSCVSNVGRGRIFVGSEQSDSLVLGWSRKSGKVQKRRVSIKMEIDGDDDVSEPEEDDIEDDDDLYAESKAVVAAPVKISPVTDADEADDYTFRIHDTLKSLAPLVDLVFATNEAADTEDERQDSNSPPETQMTASIGKGHAGAICRLSRRISPAVRAKYDLEGVNGVWPLSIQKNWDGNMDEGLNERDVERLHNFLIISKTHPSGEDRAFAFSLIADAEGLDQLAEFDSNTGATIDIGVFAGGTKVIHVVKSEVRTYDNDLGLAQIFPMADDDSPSGPKIIAVSFVEPYILLIRDDDSAMVLKAEESGDLEEVEGGKLFQSTPWVSGSLFDDSNDVFRLESDEGSDDEAGNILMFLLSEGGGLKIFRISDLSKPVYTADGLSFLPPFLSAEFAGRRSTGREALVDILIAELGDATAKAPFMILQSANNDITVYQPFQCPVEGKASTMLRFVKVSIPKVLDTYEDGLENGYHEESPQILRAIQDLDGYSVVCISGPNPSLIIKSASSLPKIIPLVSEGIRSLSGFHAQNCSRGLIYVDNEGSVYAAQLPQHSEYSTGWATEQVYAAGENIDAFNYHPTSDRYVLGTSEKVAFKLPDDELHYDWSQETATLLPQIDRGTIKVLEPSTWTITDTYPLDPHEIVLCMKTLSLETSETTHTRRPLLVIGTTILCGEDLTAQGRIYIFDIIPVVPEPDRPETGRKLKLIAKEEVKGAVTAVCGIGREGFLLAAQGQKCMVRGLKEDGTLLPVAFMDMQCYVSVLKELPGTGLCLMGDAVKGLWFTGYTEDPYQLRLFGKSSTHLEVVTAEFFPDGENLYIIVIDSDSTLHVFQFNPDHPKSLAGTRLLPLSTFHTGSFHHRSYLLPPPPLPHHSTPAHTSSSSSPPPSTSLPHHILLTSPTGTLSLISPLPPTGPHSHSQLQSLATHLQNTLVQPAGLNPKMWRAMSVDVGLGGRAVLDGNLLARRGEEGGASGGRRGGGGGGGGVRGWF